MVIVCSGLKLRLDSAASTYLLLLCAASIALCSGAAGASYAVHVLHPNARPIAAGDEITFLDRGVEPEHDHGDGFADARCPVDIVAFIERGAAPAVARVVRVEQQFPQRAAPRHTVSCGVV